MSYPTIHFEIARLRHVEDVRRAERRNSLFRRPAAVAPARLGQLIDLPARGAHTSPCDTRVA